MYHDIFLQPGSKCLYFGSKKAKLIILARLGASGPIAWRSLRFPPLWGAKWQGHGGHGGHQKTSKWQLGMIQLRTTASKFLIVGIQIRDTHGYTKHKTRGFRVEAFDIS